MEINDCHLLRLLLIVLPLVDGFPVSFETGIISDFPMNINKQIPSTIEVPTTKTDKTIMSSRVNPTSGSTESFVDTIANEMTYKIYHSDKNSDVDDSSNLDEGSDFKADFNISKDPDSKEDFYISNDPDSIEDYDISKDHDFKEYYNVSKDPDSKEDNDNYSIPVPKYSDFDYDSDSESSN